MKREIVNSTGVLLAEYGTSPLLKDQVKVSAERRASSPVDPKGVSFEGYAKCDRPGILLKLGIDLFSEHRNKSAAPRSDFNSTPRTAVEISYSIH